MMCICALVGSTAGSQATRGGNSSACFAFRFRGRSVLTSRAPALSVPEGRSATAQQIDFRSFNVVCLGSMRLLVVSFSFQTVYPALLRRSISCFHENKYKKSLALRHKPKASFCSANEQQICHLCVFPLFHSVSMPLAGDCHCH